MPANKRASIRPPQTTYKSGTHAIVQPSRGPGPAVRPRRNGLGTLLVHPEAERAAGRGADSAGASPELEIELTRDLEAEPAAKIHATVDAPCDGCGRVVEVELSRYLETNAVACPACVDALVKGWGKSIDRPTIEWEPSLSLLSASRRIDHK